jgi:hypothetical protein
MIIFKSWNMIVNVGFDVSFANMSAWKGIREEAANVYSTEA